MQLVIIAGGKGTRLGLKDIPKPMVEIDGKPLLEHQINLAKRYGIKDILILSGHLSEVITDYFKDGSDFGVNITHIIEPYPLGTAGSIKMAESLIKDRFIVFYGDIVMDFDLQSFIEFDRSYNSLGTTLVHPNDHPYDSDLVEVDKNNKVTAFHSKPHNPDMYYRNLVNAAVYIFSPEIFKYIESGKSQDFGKHIFPLIIEKGETLIAYYTPEYIKDMGTPDRFEKVKSDFISGKVARLNKKNKRKAVFLNKSSIIKNSKLTDDSAEAIRKINKSEYLSIVMANNSAEDPIMQQKYLDTLLGNEKAYLNDIYFCSTYPEKDYNIDIKSSWIIGSKEKDLIAGKSAGYRTALMNSKENSSYADCYFTNLAQAVDFILGDKNDNNQNSF
jgi:NDP-sugar pyrophosphorylase family protein